MWVFRTSPAAQCDPYYCQTLAICSVSCKSQAKISGNPSWVAWTKSELLSNPDKASVTPCLTATFLATFFIPYSHHVVYKFCGEAGRIGSRSPAYHSMDKYRMCSEKWHDRATLHTSNPGGSVKSQGWSLVSKATPAARSMC